MARKFLDTIKGAIVSDLLDNNTGLISPKDVRDVLTDMVDSLKEDEAELVSVGETTAVALTGAFVDLTTVYDFGTGDDGDFLNVNAGNGTVTGTSTAGFSYRLSGTIVATASNNEVIELTFGVDGVPTGGIITIEGSGTSDASRHWQSFIRAAPANGVFSIMAAAKDGAATVDIVSARFVVAVLPTNDA